MDWRALLTVLRENPGRYTIWLAANLGGLLVAYLAVGTIWYFHNELGKYLPGPEAFLITGTVSLAVTGVSYLTLNASHVTLSPLLSASWPFPLMAVYGVLITMGVKIPVLTSAKIWLTTVALTVACLIWSSLMWLHERGIRSDAAASIVPAPAPPAELRLAADDLPPVPAPPPTAEEERQEAARPVEGQPERAEEA